MENMDVDVDQMSVVSGTTDGSLTELISEDFLHVLPGLYATDRASPLIPCQAFNLPSTQQDELLLTPEAHNMKCVSNMTSAHEEHEMTSTCNTCPLEAPDIETAYGTGCTSEDVGNLVQLIKAADLNDTLMAVDQVVLEDSQRDLFESQAESEGGDHTQALSEGGDHTHALSEGEHTQALSEGSDHTQALSEGGDRTQALTDGGDHTQALSEGGDHTQALFEGDHTKALSEGGDHTQALTDGGDHIQALSEGCYHTQALFEGGDHTQTLFEDGDHKQTLSKGDHTQVLFEGGDHTHALSEGGNHTQALFEGGDHTQALSEGDHTQALFEGGDHKQALSEGDHTKALSEGGDHTQALFESGGHIQALFEGGDHTQALSEGDHTQALSEGGDHTQALSEGGDYTQALSEGGDHTHALSEGGNYTQALSEGADHKQALSEGGDHTQALSEGGNYTQALSEGGDHKQALPEGGNHTQALSEGGDHKQALSEGGDHTHIPLTAHTMVDKDMHMMCALDILSCSDQPELNISSMEISSSHLQMTYISQQGTSCSNLQMQISGQGDSSSCLQSKVIGDSSSCLQSKVVSEQEASCSHLQMKISGQGDSSSCLQSKVVSEQEASCSHLQMKISGQGDSSSCLQSKVVSEQEASCSHLQMKISGQGDSSSCLQSKVVSEQEASCSHLQMKISGQGDSSSCLQIQKVSERGTSSSHLQMNETCHQEMNTTEKQKNWSPEIFHLTSGSSIDLTALEQPRTVLFSVNDAAALAVAAGGDNCSTASHNTLQPLGSLQHSFLEKESMLPLTSLVSERMDMNKTATCKAGVETGGPEVSSQESKASSLLLNCPNHEGSGKTAKMVKARSCRRSSARTVGVKTPRASSHKKRVQPEQAPDQRLLPLISDLRADRSRHVDSHSSPAADKNMPPVDKNMPPDDKNVPAADKNVPAVDRSPVCENSFTDRMKPQSSERPKGHSKELHRLVDLYDKMLDKLSAGRVVDGRDQLQKFEQIVHKLKATHESYKARLLSLADRQGATWQRQWQHMLDNQVMLGVACDKHELLTQRVRTLQADSQGHKPDGLRQQGLQTSASAGHSCCPLSSSNSLRDFNSSALWCGATEYRHGKGRSGTVSTQQGDGDYLTLTRSGQAGVTSCRDVGIQRPSDDGALVWGTSNRDVGTQKASGDGAFVEGNSSRHVGLRRTGVGASCRLTMDSETTHLTCAPAAGACNLPQTSAYQQEIQYSHETSSVETIQAVSHVPENVILQAVSHAPENVILQAGSHVPENVILQAVSLVPENVILQAGSHVQINPILLDDSGIEKNVSVCNDDSCINGSIISVDDDSDIGDTVIKAADTTTKKRHPDIGDTVIKAADTTTKKRHPAVEEGTHPAVEEGTQNSHGGGPLGPANGTVSPTACENFSAAPSREKCVEASGRKRLFKLDPGMESVNCLAGKVQIMSGKSSQETRSRMRSLQDQQLPSMLVTQAEEISPALTPSKSTGFIVTDRTCLQKQTQETEVKRPSLCLADVRFSESSKVHQVHNVTSQSLGRDVVQETSGPIDGRETGGLEPWSTAGRLPGPPSSTSLSDQHLAQTLAGVSLVCDADDASGTADTALAKDVGIQPVARELTRDLVDIALAEDVHTIPTTRELRNCLNGNRLLVEDDKYTTTTPDLVATYKTQTEPAAASTRDVKNRASQRSVCFVPVVPGTTDTEHGVPVVPGTADTEHGVPVVPGTADTEHGVPVVPGTADTEHGVPVVPGTADTEHGVPVVPGTADIEHGVPVVPGTADIEHGVPVVPGTADIEHGVPEVPGTTDFKHIGPIVPGTADIEQRVPEVPGTIDFKHRDPIVPGTTDFKHRGPIVPGATDFKHRGPIVPGTADTEHGVPVVPGTADSEHGVPVVPGTADTEHGVPVVPGTADTEHGVPVVPGTADIEHGVPVVPGTADIEHGVPEVPGTTDFKHIGPIVPGTADIEQRVPEVPGTIDFKHRDPIVPGTTDFKHRGPIVPGTADIEQRVHEVPGTIDFEHKGPIVPSTTDSDHEAVLILPCTTGSDHKVSLVPGTTTTEPRAPPALGTAGCQFRDSRSHTAVDNVTSPQVADSSQPGVFDVGGSTPFPAASVQGHTVAQHVVPRLPGAQVSHTGKLNVHKSESCLPSNTTNGNIRSKPAFSPSSTVSSSLFVVSSKEIARRMDRKTSEKHSFASQNQITQTGNSNLYRQVMAAAKPRTYSIFGLQSVDATNLSIKISPATVGSTSRPDPATFGDKLLASNLGASSCQPQVASYSRNPAASAHKNEATSDSRKRCRPRKNSTAGSQGKKSRHCQLTNTSNQGQIQHYFPLSTQFVAPESGSVTDSVTSHGSTNTCLSTRQSHISVNYNTGTWLDSTQSKLHAETNQTAQLPPCGESSRKSGVAVDVPALIRNLRSVLLIADEEIMGTSGDFPPDFWEEDFTNIRMSESVWTSLEDW